jgi:hypothetical protein
MESEVCEKGEVCGKGKKRSLKKFFLGKEGIGRGRGRGSGGERGGGGGGGAKQVVGVVGVVSLMCVCVSLWLSGFGRV